jgi:hypothetical protein
LQLVQIAWQNIDMVHARARIRTQQTRSCQIARPNIAMVFVARTRTKPMVSCQTARQNIEVVLADLHT